MTATKSAVKPSMNEAHERDPFNNNSYGTLVDQGYKTVSLPVLDVPAPVAATAARDALSPDDERLAEYRPEPRALPSFHVWTLGCQMNRSDSEEMAGRLLAAEEICRSLLRGSSRRSVSSTWSRRCTATAQRARHRTRLRRCRASATWPSAARGFTSRR